ncbi:conjugal transfer pilus assembly protein TraF [Buttiauxella sp. BIGb0552]|uniref:conjugal transfer protein TraF n=1 Tax=Buttiauxella sp. BIGb0552 TaxID=2485120 RepID=UPI0010654095|nr:conjugal transfer protein TraF [Buttiauxella sp. BIGb0552]TDX11965.1 conjugal transfer pilus assembly protein TraF [Buttiauxella sp. BIGb0552]
MNLTRRIPTKTFVLLALLTTNALAAVDETKIEGTPFVSGQSFKKGFFWYDDPSKKPIEEQEELKSAPPAAQDVQPENVDLNSAWLKASMPKLLTQAMDNPTPENLSRYYTAQRLMLDISTRFSDKSKDYFLKNPMMSEKRRQPVEKAALDAHRAIVDNNQQTVMKDIFSKSGLFFFFQSTCQFCHEESQILTFMQNYYSADILPVSMDGMGLHNGLFQNFTVPNAQIIDQFKIREVPTLYLVSKDGQSAQRISEGMISAEELKNTIILAAKGMNLINDADFQSTLDIKRQYTIGDDGVISVPKAELDADPYLLQRIMDKKLEGYDMPTADPVHYMNAGFGVQGGNYGQ